MPRATGGMDVETIVVMSEEEEDEEDEEEEEGKVPDEQSSASVESSGTEAGQATGPPVYTQPTLLEPDVSSKAEGLLDAVVHLPQPAVYLCLDIEATCDGKASSGVEPRVFSRDFENEVLELPVEVVDAATGQILSDTLPGWSFHTYVRPEVLPTPFCTELTGIDAATLDQAPKLAEALRRLEAWLRRRRLAPWPLARTEDGELNFVWVTDGTWDFGKFLWHDCRRKQVPFPFACASWCDVRKAFHKTWPSVPLQAPVLQNMVKAAGLAWSGPPHRGHVDTKNLASLISVIAGCNPQYLLPCRYIATSLLAQLKAGVAGTGFTGHLSHHYPHPHWAQAAMAAGSGRKKRAPSSVSSSSSTYSIAPQGGYRVRYQEEEEHQHLYHRRFSGAHFVRYSQPMHHQEQHLDHHHYAQLMHGCYYDDAACYGYGSTYGAYGGKASKSMYGNYPPLTLTHQHQNYHHHHHHHHQQYLHQQYPHLPHDYHPQNQYTGGAYLGRGYFSGTYRGKQVMCLYFPPAVGGGVRTPPATTIQPSSAPAATALAASSQKKE